MQCIASKFEWHWHCFEMCSLPIKGLWTKGIGEINNVTGWRLFKGNVAAGDEIRWLVKYYISVKQLGMSIKDGGMLLQHVKVVQQTRELIGALSCVATGGQLWTSATSRLLKGEVQCIVDVCLSPNTPNVIGQYSVLHNASPKIACF